MGASLVRLDHDWGAVVAAAEADVASDEAWIGGVLDRLAGLFDTKSDAAFSIVQHDEACTSARYLALRMPHPYESLVSIEANAGLTALGIDGFHAFYYPSRTVTCHSEIERDLGEGARADTIRETARVLRAQLGVEDIFGAFAYPEPGILLSMFAMHDRPIVLTRYERLVVTRLMLHLESNYRLRRRPESVVAVLDREARVLERSSDAPSSELMTAHVAQRRAADGRTLWPALLSGRVSIVARGTGRGRRYFVLENAPRAQPFRALTPSEVAVVSQAARGHSTKLIAFALGVSPSTVSACLTAAASKLGVATRMDLIRLAAMLIRDPRAGFEKIALTDAERDVLDLVRRGLSNQDIAKMRSRSVRTIANQVASLLRKTSATSRRELVARGGMNDD